MRPNVIKFVALGTLSRTINLISGQNTALSLPGTLSTGTLDTDPCGGEITNQSSGTITSPNFDPIKKTKYPSNTTCQWRIFAPEGHYIELDIEYIDIEPGPDVNELKPECPYDALEIYDLGNVLMSRLPQGKIDRLDDYFEYKLRKSQLDTIKVRFLELQKYEHTRPIC